MHELAPIHIVVSFQFTLWYSLKQQPSLRTLYLHDTKSLYWLVTSCMALVLAFVVATVLTQLE